MMKQSGRAAGEDFGDNRVPGGDYGSEELDRSAEIRQPNQN